MSNNTSIEWADATWNPTTGCAPVSAGCERCYAHRFAKRLAGRCGYPKDEPFRVTLHPERLEEPFGWRKPRRVFVNSMGDLFHKDVPDEFIDRVFAVMALCPQHTFMVLTKRPERMVRWFQRFNEVGEPVLGDSPIGAWLNGPYGWLLGQLRELPGGNENWHYVDLEYEGGQVINGDHFDWIGEKPISEIISWPLPNVWLGVTAENQETAEERIPILLQTPAVVRFVSCEPLLSAIDLSHWLTCACDEYWPGQGHHPECPTQKLHWCIVGGETGPGARPMHPDWVRSLRDQCQAAGVPFFLKQMHIGGKLVKMPELDGRRWDELPCF